MNERDIFIGALQLDPVNRPAYLDRECSGNPGVRERVDALMQAFGEAGSFLQQPAGGDLATLEDRDVGRPAPREVERGRQAEGARANDHHGGSCGHPAMSCGAQVVPGSRRGAVPRRGRVPRRGAIPR